MADTVLLLANMGGPSSLAEVEGYLRAIFADPAILPVPGLARAALGWWITRRRAPKVRERYQRIGGGSPLGDWTRRQVAGVSKALQDDGSSLRVEHAFRYTAPSLSQVISAQAERGAKRILLLPLFPHHTDAMTGSIEREARRAAEQRSLELCTIDAWGARPTVLDRWSELLGAAVERAGAGARVLFVAHGIPQRSVRRGETYPAKVAASARELGNRLPDEVAWSLAYQSRVGPVRWTEPYLEVELERLAASKAPVVLMPLSFVAECLETLYDLDEVATTELRQAGVDRVERVQAFNDDARFCRIIAQLAMEALQEKSRV